MPENLEARLRALEDREAIRELRATYCFLVDGWFTDDARCDFGAALGEAPALSLSARRSGLARGSARQTRHRKHPAA